MISYKRNINQRIYVLRIVLVLGIGVLLYLFAIGALWASVLIIVVLLFLGFISVTALYIESGLVKIIRFTAYGFKKVTTAISESSGHKGEMFLNGDIDQVPDADHPFGLVVLLIPFLYKKYILWVYNATGDRIFTVGLTSQEFDFLKEAAHSYKALPLTVCL